MPPAPSGRIRRPPGTSRRSAPARRRRSQSEGAVAWNDPELGIDWRISADEVILSEKDKVHPLLKDAVELFDYSVDYYI